MFYEAIKIIKYKKLTSLHYCVSATKSHIQNSRNHLARTQSKGSQFVILSLCDHSTRHMRFPIGVPS